MRLHPHTWLRRLLPRSCFLETRVFVISASSRTVNKPLRYRCDEPAQITLGLKVPLRLTEIVCAHEERHQRVRPPRGLPIGEASTVQLWTIGATEGPYERRIGLRSGGACRDQKCDRELTVSFGCVLLDSSNGGVL